MDSLHRLHCATPDILILDESNSLHLHTCNLEKQAAKCTDVLEDLLRYSGQVIALDAMLDCRTIRMLQQTARPITTLVNSHNERSKRIQRIYDEESIWDQALSAALDDPQQLRIVMPFTDKCDARMYAKRIAAKYPSRKVLLYTGEDGDRDDMRDVNSTWADCDVLIYNVCISAGISFDLDRFDVLFANIKQQQNIDVQTVAQMLYRVRRLSANTMHIYMRRSSPQWYPETQDDVH